MNKGWGILALVVAGLYWLQAVLIPLALAVLLTFLLSPVVGTLERRGLGRVPSVFVAVNRFGNLGRNVVIGPGFRNTDLSISKSGRLGDLGVQLRADIFDLFNHPNFGPPGEIVGSPTFGKITRTRLPTGEAGSSRQVQLAARMSF